MQKLQYNHFLKIMKIQEKSDCFSVIASFLPGLGSEFDFVIKNAVHKHWRWSRKKIQKFKTNTVFGFIPENQPGFHLLTPWIVLSILYWFGIGTICRLYAKCQVGGGQFYFIHVCVCGGGEKDERTVSIHAFEEVHLPLRPLLRQWFSVDELKRFGGDALNGKKNRNITARGWPSIIHTTASHTVTAKVRWGNKHSQRGWFAKEHCPQWGGKGKATTRTTKTTTKHTQKRQQNAKCKKNSQQHGRE